MDHVVLSLVMPWLGARDRACLASVDKTCRAATRRPCPCDSVSAQLPPRPGAGLYAWLATHRATTLRIAKHTGESTAEFVRSLHDAVDAMSMCPGGSPARVDIDGDFFAGYEAGDAAGVCGALTRVLGLGVGHLSCRTPVAAYPDEHDMCIRLDARTHTLELELDVDALELSGSAAGLRELSLRNTVPLTAVTPPETGFPELRRVTLHRVFFDSLLRDSAPKLHTLYMGEVRHTLCTWPAASPRTVAAASTLLTERPRLHMVAGSYMDPGALAGIPATSAVFRLPYDWCFYWAGSALAASLRELELDMGHWRAEEFSFACLVGLPRLHTLGLSNLVRQSCVDDLFAWAINGVPPALRRVWARIPTEFAVDNPHEIRRFLTSLMATYRLECECVLC